MKNGNPCPKCGSDAILSVPGSAAGYGSGNSIPLSSTVLAVVHITRYICAKCGFNEEWIDTPEELDQLWQKYGPRS
jgi:ribosomal protein S27AE